MRITDTVPMIPCDPPFMEAIRAVLSGRRREVIEQTGLPRAAVLVPLFQKAGDCRFLFTRRSDTVKHHRGEISFPGGTFDEEDGDLERTALREAWEEIGLREGDVRILGVLDDIETRTGFIVTPFAGVIPSPYSFTLSEREIAELIEVPLSTLTGPDCYGEHEIVHQGLKRVVPSYRYGPHIIWGATARILRQFLGLLPFGR
jgi:8-oxo-dGTP pyrophosphatase MutT (NUDIX family)